MDTVIVCELTLSSRNVNQIKCPHDAKVKMAGFRDKYECTRCHKFIVFENNPIILEAPKKGDRQ